MNNNHLKPTIDKLNDLTCIIEQDRKSICKHYGFSDTTDDVRITFYHKMQNVITPTNYSISFLATSLFDKQWWIDHATDKSDIEIQHQQEYYEDFVRIGFLQTAFMAIESTLRIILKGIKPNACNNATDAFENIYKHLFKELSNHKDFQNTLDFLRLLRNTVHDNGIYYQKKSESVNINWNEKSFTFTPGKKIEFATWDLLLELLIDILHKIKMLLTSEQLTKFQNTIPDPFAH